MDLAKFAAILRRIPVFEGVEPDHAKLILQGCEQRSLKPGDTICLAGEGSEALYILVSGKASVRGDTGAQIAVIEPIAPIGEMGVFTGEPRSATVVAREAASVLELSKPRLFSMLRRNPNLELVVSRNLIAILADRLRKANAELGHLQGLLSDQEEGAKAEEEAQDDAGASA